MEPAAKQFTSDALNTLGAIYYRHGKFALALSTLKQALGKRGSEAAPFDWIFLAMTHQALGQQAEAESFRQKFDSWWEQQQELLRNNQRADPQLTWEVRCELPLLAEELHQHVPIQ